jgi:integrase
VAGVSVQELGGQRYRLRWRERVEKDGKKAWADKSLVVHSREASIELQAKVLRALETQGWFELEVKPVELVGNLEAAGQAWLRHKAARGRADGSITRYASILNRWFKFIRAKSGLAENAAVPVDVLSRELFSEAILAWRADGLSDSTIYNTTRVGVELWDWVFDDLATYPGVPTPPRNKKALLPQAAVYAAPEAPTMDEIDACLRALHFRAYTARGVGVIMRFTGLRVSQVMSLTCRDVNLARLELRVTTGKSRREQAEQRVVPISPHLAAELEPWVSRQKPEAPLVQRRTTGREPTNNLPMRTLEAAWEAATKEGTRSRGCSPDCGG